MLKKISFLLLLYTVSISSNAQLKVDSTGKVVAGTKIVYNSSVWDIGFQSGLTSSSAANSIAIYGNSFNNYGAFSYGVFGVAGGTNGTAHAGVVGCLESSCGNGAGIIGASQYITYLSLSGYYAGYFLGSTKVTGSLTANSFVQNSDLRLKENIIPLKRNNERILDKVLDMNVIEYNYKPIIPSLLLPDSVSTKEIVKNAGIDTNKKHYGVIAQELKELFPDLVEEDQDGYLGVNYVELVPVLVCAIQELKAQVDILRDNAEQATNRTPSTTSVNNLFATGNFLYQNRPNPFNEQTIIRFELADNVQNAAICIFDMQGKMLKNIPVLSGMERVSINGSELGKGMFLYSLLINGQEIDTKRMVISK